MNRGCVLSFLCLLWPWLFQDLFEEFQRARIFRLPQPEHRLFANGRVLVGAGLLNQQRHALVFGQLAQREHRFLFHLGVGIVLDRRGNRADGFLSCALREPEERVAFDRRRDAVSGVLQPGSV